jgi:hypothetical protein
MPPLENGRPHCVAELGFVGGASTAVSSRPAVFQRVRVPVVVMVASLHPGYALPSLPGSTLKVESRGDRSAVRAWTAGVAVMR